MSDPKDHSLVKHFEEAKRFTEELIKENERLRLVNTNLRTEMRDLEKRYISVEVPKLQDRVKMLEEQNAALKQELDEIKEHYSTVEKENLEFSQRYLDVERQNSNLINMYVASYRLHSTLDYQEVMQIIEEIVINLIGSEWFSIYVVDEANKRLCLIDHVSIGKVDAPPPVKEIFSDDGKVWTSVRNAETFVSEQNPAPAGQPLACIPLKTHDKVMGIIVIHELLIQKDGFQSLDYELFELLGTHAATAIFGSHLYSVVARQGNISQSFIEATVRRDA